MVLRVRLDMMPFDKAGSQHKGGGGLGGVEINYPFLFVLSGQSLTPTALKEWPCTGQLLQPSFKNISAF